MAEQIGGLCGVVEHRIEHAVVQQRRDIAPVGGEQLRRPDAGCRPPPFDSLDRVQPVVQAIAGTFQNQGEMSPMPGGTGEKLGPRSFSFPGFL